MIQGLFEAHLPVKDLEASIKFYEKLGLKLKMKDEETAFFWLEEGKSWLGIWEGEEYRTPYHPSMRHIAFRTSWEGMKNSISWLKSLGIEAVPFGGQPDSEPFVRLHQGNASVYFQDPDGNSLELMCHVEVPSEYRKLVKKVSLAEFEELCKTAV